MRNRLGVRAATPKFSPRVEQLEIRDCPAAPLITGLAYEPAGQQITLSGHVADEQPSGLTVNITGAYSGSVNTNAAGNFQVQFTPSQFGMIFCTVTDNENLTSRSATIQLLNSAPTITNFGATRTINDIWTFSGHVNDDNAAGLTVRFGGLMQLQGVTVTVDANGDFTYTAEMGVNFLGGTATAQTTDWWGQDSNVASYFIFPSI